MTSSVPTWSDRGSSTPLASAMVRHRVGSPYSSPEMAQSVSPRSTIRPRRCSVEASAPTEQRRVRIVDRGDTLWAIAGEEYGAPTEWRTIADENGIDDPRTLQVGTELVIPPRGEG